jgi:hypothetical protein
MVVALGQTRTRVQVVVVARTTQTSVSRQISVSGGTMPKITNRTRDQFSQVSMCRSGHGAWQSAGTWSDSLV